MGFRFAKQILQCELMRWRTKTVPFEGRIPLSTVVLCSKTRQFQCSTKLKTAQDRLQLCLPPSATSLDRIRILPQMYTKPVNVPAYARALPDIVNLECVSRHNRTLCCTSCSINSRHIPRSIYPVVHSRGYIN